MPPRMMSVAILLFWISSTGWLLYRDLIPRLIPGQPPPFTIDLVEEAQTKRTAIEWTVLHNENKTFRARTRVTNPEHDVFELISEFSPISPNSITPIHGITVQRMESVYRVNHAGDLLGLMVQIEGTPKVAEVLKIPASYFTAKLMGNVHSGIMKPRLELHISEIVKTRDLPDVAVPAGGSILLPLHPMNRIAGLKPSQSWHIQVFDPLSDPLGAFQGNPSNPDIVRARVRNNKEILTWGRRKDVECYVIDYEGDQFTGSTWVAREQGLVLRQEARIDSQKWVLLRD